MVYFDDLGDQKPLKKKFVDFPSDRADDSRGYIHWLVVEPVEPSEKYDFVSWEIYIYIYSQYMEK